MMACRCVCRPQTMMISWLWHVDVSNSQDVDVSSVASVEITRCRYVCRTHKMMIAFRCVCRTHKIVGVSFEFYPSQTKILDGLTKDEIQIFDIPFKGVSTRFGLRTIAKYIEKSGFHLLSILPKSSFGEHKFVGLKGCVYASVELTRWW